MAERARKTDEERNSVARVSRRKTHTEKKIHTEEYTLLDNGIERVHADCTALY